MFQLKEVKGQTVTDKWLLEYKRAANAEKKRGEKYEKSDPNPRETVFQGQK